MRAQMSEDTAQGQESESLNARGVVIFFQTLIYADLRRFEFVSGVNRELARGRRVPIGARPAFCALGERG